MRGEIRLLFSIFNKKIFLNNLYFLRLHPIKGRPNRSSIQKSYDNFYLHTL